MEKPYTLHRDIGSFLNDYLDDTMSRRVWSVRWDISDYISEIASNDEELTLLNRWKDWIIDARAKVEAAPLEKKQEVAEKLDADNAEMIEKINKLFSSSRGIKVQS